MGQWSATWIGAGAGSRTDTFLGVVPLSLMTAASSFLVPAIHTHPPPTTPSSLTRRGRRSAIDPPELAPSAYTGAPGGSLSRAGSCRTTSAAALASAPLQGITAPQVYAADDSSTCAAARPNQRLHRLAAHSFLSPSFRLPAAAHHWKQRPPPPSFRSRLLMAATAYCRRSACFVLAWLWGRPAAVVTAGVGMLMHAWTGRKDRAKNNNSWQEPLLAVPSALLRCLAVGTRLTPCMAFTPRYGRHLLRT